MDAEENSGEQRSAVPDREQADVENDVLQLVEEENDTDEEGQMVVPGDHVFGPQVNKSRNRRALIGLNETGVALRYVMCIRRAREHQAERDDQKDEQRGNTVEIHTREKPIMRRS